MFDPQTLEGFRDDYENGLLTIARLCKKYSVTSSDLQKFRKDLGWRARPSTIASIKAYKAANAISNLMSDNLLQQTLAADATDVQPLSPASDPPQARAPEKKSKRPGGSLAHRKELIQRLYRLYDAKLGELEARVGQRRDLKPAELDAELKAFGALIKHFESLTDLSDAAPKSTRPSDTVAASVAPTDPAAADDAERLRQDLVERFHRLRQSHAGEPPAG